MPLYDFSCGTHGVFEQYTRMGATSAPCPQCEADSSREFAITSFPKVHRPFDKQVDGHLPPRERQQVIDRAGGGKAGVVKDTGGYRPLITHNTVCPNEKRWRNVAVLADLPWGQRLNCEACGYVWVYQAGSTDLPLNDWVESSYRPSTTVHMSPDVPLHSGYEAPERGG